MDKKISKCFCSLNASRVRRIKVPSCTRLLWKAVKTAWDTNGNLMSNILYLNDSLVPGKDFPDVFAPYLDTKIKKLMDDTSVDVNMYNSKKLVTCMKGCS
jgi:hypothetical protein